LRPVVKKEKETSWEKLLGDRQNPKVIHELQREKTGKKERGSLRTTGRNRGGRTVKPTDDEEIKFREKPEREDRKEKGAKKKSVASYDKGPS